MYVLLGVHVVALEPAEGPVLNMVCFSFLVDLEDVSVWYSPPSDQSGNP